MAFTQILKFRTKPEGLQQFKQCLLEVQKNTLNEPGNLAIRAYVDNSDENLLFIYTRWQDKAALQQHTEQAYTLELKALAQQSLTEAPEIYSLIDTNPAPVPPKSAAVNDSPFNIFFIFKIKPNTRESLLSQFEKHIQHTRQESGCLLFDLYCVEDDSQTLAVYEHWRKESDVWDIHFKQPYAVQTGQLMESSIEGDMQQYMNFVTQIA